MHTLVICDRRRPLRSIAREVGISFGAVQSILTGILGMSKVPVPRMVNDDQKRTRLNFSRSRYEDDPGNFIKRIVTKDETWVHHFDPESKIQSIQWKHPGSPPPKKFKRVHSAGKVMASIFWDSQGVIEIDYLEQDGMINSAYYAGLMRWLCQKIARKRRGKLNRGVLLLQENTPAHTSQVAMTAVILPLDVVMTECGFEIPPYPPNSSDMAPSDFYLFPKLKSNLRGTRYGSNEGVIEA